MHANMYGFKCKYVCMEPHIPPWVYRGILNKSAQSPTEVFLVGFISRKVVLGLHSLFQSDIYRKEFHNV